jgi:hypothetical protein
MIITMSQSRAKITGRVVPRAVLIDAIKQVPKSVQILQSSVDFFLEIHNSQERNFVEIVTEGVSWDAFAHTWEQTCAATAS